MAKKASSIETPEAAPLKTRAKKTVSAPDEAKPVKPKTVKKKADDETIPVNTTLSEQTVAVDPEPSDMQESSAQPLEEHIRIAAYYCWIDRGMPFGTPEDDWCEAEKRCRE